MSMKILHVIPSVGPLRGGPSLVISAMTKGLAQAGLNVHVAATDDNGQEHLDVPLGYPVVQDGVTFWHFRRQTSFYAASWPLTRWLAQHVPDYDLLHIHALFSYAAIPAAFLAARYGVPYMVRPLGTLNRWGMQQRHPLLKYISFHLVERRIVSQAEAVHYTSEKERLEAAELGVACPCVVIPLGVDFSSFTHRPSAGSLRARYPRLAGRVVLLFLSRIDPIKGMDLLLHAFAEVRQGQSDVALVVAGDDHDVFVAQLKAEVARLGLEDDVVWAGFLAGEAKLAAFADADVFVLPSYSESFGIAMIEAMAAGLPVIVSDQVGLAGDIERAQAGLVVRCEATSLAKAMKRLTEESETRRTMGANGRRLVEERYTWGRVSKDLIQVYEDILNGTQRSATWIE